MPQVGVPGLPRAGAFARRGLRARGPSRTGLSRTGLSRTGRGSPGRSADGFSHTPPGDTAL